MRPRLGVSQFLIRARDAALVPVTSHHRPIADSWLTSDDSLWRTAQFLILGSIPFPFRGVTLNALGPFRRTCREGREAGRTGRDTHSILNQSHTLPHSLLHTLAVGKTITLRPNPSFAADSFLTLPWRGMAWRGTGAGTGAGHQYPFHAHITKS